MIATNAANGTAGSEPVKLGLIGAGAISRAYADALSRTGRARLVAVADVRRDAAQALAEDARARAFASYGELAEEGGCEAVIVCTPPASHPQICIDLLERGLHVLCEKPLAVESARAREMLEVAERSGALFTMASKFRYVDDVIRAKQIVTSGILGEILLFENAFTARVDMGQRWNADPAVSGGGVLIDNGTHSVDLMRYLLGPIAEVHAVEGKRAQRLRVEDTARIFLRSADGVIGNVDLSWSLNKELGSFIDVYGSQGTVRVGWKESRYRQSERDDWVVFGAGYDKVAAFVRQIENFCGAIRGEDLLMITAEDAIASVEVIEAAYRSLASGGWEPVQAAAPRRARPPLRVERA